MVISPVTERPQGLHLSTQTLKSSSTSCFKYFAIVNFARKANVLAVVRAYSRNKGMHAIFQKKSKKGLKGAKYLKIWAKMYKISIIL